MYNVSAHTFPYTGLATTLGMTWLHVPGATGSYDSRFHLKGRAICEGVVSGGFDFGFVHVKAVDDAGHDRLWALRVRYIELMDMLMAQILARLHAAEQVRPMAHATPAPPTRLGPVRPAAFARHVMPVQT